MRLKTGMALLLFSFLSLGYGVSHASWQAVARDDLNAIHDLINYQTPAAVDVDNPRIRRWLKYGFDAALQRVSAVRNAQDYYFLLSYYVNGFHDPHIVAKFTSPQVYRQLIRYWPGFLLRYQHKIFTVSAYQHQGDQWPDLPPAGSTLSQCDGLSPADLMKKRVFPYNGHSSEYADWVRYAPLLLIYMPHAWTEALTTCTFIKDKKSHTVNLQWKPIQKRLDLRKVTYAYQPRFIRQLLEKDVVWVSLPTFAAKQDMITRDLQQVVYNVEKWRKKAYIVFDVRGNTGGNSAWGTRILSHLYGDNFYYWSQGQSPNVHYAQWRVSTENSIYLYRDTLPYVARTLGQDSQQFRYMSRVLDAMVKGLENKESLISVTKDQKYEEPLQKTPPQNPVSANVIVVTDGRCASACLSFIDKLRNLPNIKILGEPTYVDTSYTEIRFEPLPSGFAKLGFPIKMWRGRKRADYEAYQPDLWFPGDINDTDALQTWVLQLIDQKKI